jgi:hypothetical protein
MFLAVFYCCNIYSQADMQKEIDDLKQVDIDFSDLSKKTDMRQAFLAYVHTEGVLLRPDNNPIVGYENVKKELGDEPVNFTLTWEPLYGDVSLSADLGYTYGIYELSFKDDKGAEQVLLNSCCLLPRDSQDHAP